MLRPTANQEISGGEKNDPEIINNRSLQEFQELDWVRSKRRTGIVCRDGR